MNFTPKNAVRFPDLVDRVGRKLEPEWSGRETKSYAVGENHTFADTLLNEAAARAVRAHLDQALGGPTWRHLGVRSVQGVEGSRHWDAERLNYSMGIALEARLRIEPNAEGLWAQQWKYQRSPEFGAAAPFAFLDAEDNQTQVALANFIPVVEAALEGARPEAEAFRGERSRLQRVLDAMRPDLFAGDLQLFTIVDFKEVDVPRGTWAQDHYHQIMLGVAWSGDPDSPTFAAKISGNSVPLFARTSKAEAWMSALNTSAKTPEDAVDVAASDNAGDAVAVSVPSDANILDAAKTVQKAIEEEEEATKEKIGRGLDRHVSHLIVAVLEGEGYAVTSREVRDSLKGNGSWSTPTGWTKSRSRGEWQIGGVCDRLGIDAKRAENLTQKRADT